MKRNSEYNDRNLEHNSHKSKMHSVICIQFKLNTFPGCFIDMVRDQSILLLFSPIFLSGDSFSLPYYHAQGFSRSFNNLLKVELYS